ncbi:MAG: TolC family protein, partial [Planctomycetota bacterium]|nr:TolC family protein [Planctomycetota bacterium]
MVDPQTLPKALLLAAGLALPACQTPPGAAEPVRLDQALELPAAWSRAGEAGTWAAGGWWRDLASPELDALVEAGLAGSPDLASAAQAVRIASLRLDAAGGAGLPQVDASLSLARARNNFVGLPIPGGGDVLTTYSSSRALSLNVAWELDVWGRLSNQEAGTLAQLEATSFEWQAARLSLTAQVARLALGLGVAQAQVDLSRAGLANAEAQRAAAAGLSVRGVGAPAAPLPARAAATGAGADLAEARRNLRSLEPVLHALVGRAPGTTGEVDTAALAALV